MQEKLDREANFDTEVKEIEIYKKELENLVNFMRW